MKPTKICFSKGIDFSTLNQHHQINKENQEGAGDAAARGPSLANTLPTLMPYNSPPHTHHPEAHHWQILCPPSCPITLLRTHTIQNNCMWCTAAQKESPVFDMLSGQPKSDFLLTKLLETSQTDQKLMLICATCNCHCRP